MPLLIRCSSPFAAPRHPHTRAPPHVCCYVCRVHAQPCLSMGWALNRRFDLTFGTAAVLAQGGGGVGAQTNRHGWLPSAPFTAGRAVYFGISGCCATVLPWLAAGEAFSICVLVPLITCRACISHPWPHCPVRCATYLHCRFGT